jgi:hypothetical protein
MGAGPDGDRLAVWTFVKNGEEVVYGDPWVTDAERATHLCPRRSPVVMKGRWGLRQDWPTDKHGEGTWMYR